MAAIENLVQPLPLGLFAADTSLLLCLLQFVDSGHITYDAGYLITEHYAYKQAE